MEFTVSLFVRPPGQPLLREEDFAGAADLASLLLPDAQAGLEIATESDRLLAYDALDALIRGVCIAGGRALAEGGVLQTVSFEGFDSVTIEAFGETARFSCLDEAVSAPREQALAALRGQAGRFGQLLQRVFPSDAERARDFNEFAAG